MTPMATVRSMECSSRPSKLLVEMMLGLYGWSADATSALRLLPDLSRRFRPHDRPVKVAVERHHLLPKRAEHRAASLVSQTGELAILAAVIDDWQLGS